jgi:hypothetical protein
LTNRKIDIDKPNKLPLPSLKTLLINLVFSLVLGFLGPFGSYAIPLMKRLLYWFIMFNIGHFIYFLSHKLTAWYFKNKSPHPILRFLTPTLIATIPLSILVGFATLQVGYQFIVSMSFFIYIIPQVFLLGVIIEILMQAIYTKQVIEDKKKPNHTFINRLPVNLGSNLICLAMEDHYIQVYTDLGSHMILMRMKDALVELQDYQGFQVHRSYWVATSAIESVIRKSRKTTLVMKNGLKIPVSRKYQPKIKQIGL